MLLVKFFAILLILAYNGSSSASTIKAATTSLQPLVPSEKYLHKMIVDERSPDQYVLFWNIIEDSIQFEVHVKTTGWVGLGISPNGGMPGSDIAIGWVNDADGTAVLRDCYAEYQAQPTVDAKQDWTLIAGKQINGYTILKYSRKLETCDLENDYTIQTGSNYMIFAWNNEDPVGNNWKKHETTSRRTRVALLINYKTEAVEEQDALPSDAFYYEFRNKDVTIPEKETFYYCDTFEIPRFVAEEIQLIRIDIVANPKNVDFLHHTVIYECRDDFAPTERLNHECGAVSIPIEFAKNCLNKYVFAWGTGGPFNYSFPKNTGYGVSYAPGATKKFYLVETHYNNPNHVKGVIDNSGIRFFYTKQLRTQNLGLLRIGTDDLPLSVQIPPKSKKFTYTSICYPQCTQKFFPSSGITAVSGIMHTHLLGRSLRTMVIRKNKEIGYIFNSPHYDFNYQFVIDIAPFKLYQGDALVTECTYDSTDRVNFTLWGFASVEEMCVQNIFYYPRIPNFIQCHSVPSHSSLAEFYTSLMNENLLPKTSLTKDLSNGSYDQMVKILKNANPNDNLIQKFNEYYKSTPNQGYFCGEPSSSESIDVKNEKFFAVANKYIEPNVCRASSINFFSYLLLASLLISIFA